VRAGLDALEKNRAVVVSGLINKVGAASTRFAPRSIVRKIAGSIKY
jgi:short-subunit dehydrogenase